MRALMSAYSSSQARRRRSSSRGDSALPISDSIILSGRRKQSLSGAERSGARAQRDGSGRDDRGAVRHGVVGKAGVLGPGTLVVFSLLLPSRAAGSRTRDGAARTRAAPSADSGAYRRARNGGSGAGITREVSRRAAGNLHAQAPPHPSARHALRHGEHYPHGLWQPRAAQPSSARCAIAAAGTALQLRDPATPREERAAGAVR